MAGAVSIGIGVIAIVVLAIGFFAKRREALLAGWFAVIAAVAAGIAGY